MKTLIIELACSVRTGKILVSFFCKFMDLACGSVHKLAKEKNWWTTNIVRVRTSR